MFDGRGNLPAGFHDWSLAEIEANLVDAFPTSTSRPMILNGYKTLRGQMEQFGFEAEHWLDGSFTTRKLDPGDLDLLTIADKATLDSLPPSEQQKLLALVRMKATRATHMCDSYILPSVPDTHPDYDHFRHFRKYWMGEFGFDRDDAPKGIVRTRLRPAGQGGP